MFPRRVFRKRKAPDGDGGITPRYRSRSEEKTAAFLTERGVPFEYEKRKVCYIRPARKSTYTPDFELPGGVLVEVKGFWPPADRQKLLLIKRSNPDLDVRMLFDTPDRPILKGSSTTYGMFCTKNGVPWAKGPNVPEGWLPSSQPEGNQ